MKKIVSFFTGLVCACSVNAQNYTDSMSVDLQTVDVVKNVSGLASESLRIVTTLSRADIAALPVRNINELLDYIPGIDVRSRGVNGVQADISMRGGTFDQVVILLNGINITDPQTGHQNLDLPVDVSMIDRIEVLQGTALNTYGLSAFSGAVNIITGEEPENLIKAGLISGEHGLFSPYVTVARHLKKLSLYGSLNHNQSSGYINNTDYNYTNAFLQMRYADTSIGAINAQIGLQTKDFGANAFYSAKYPNQYEIDKVLLSSVQWQKQFGRLQADASGYMRLHYDEFHLFRKMENAPAWYTGHNHHVTEVGGATMKLSYLTSLGKTTVGAELRDDNIKSTVLGDSLDNPVDVPFVSADSVQFIYGKNRLNVNYFAEQTFRFGAMTASIGASGNYNSLFGSSMCWGVNAGYALSEQNRIFANVNKALRLPTFTDMYYKSATQLANPDLQPEESMTFEVGNKGQYAQFSYRASTYYRIGSQIIDWAKKAEDAVWKSMNIDDVSAFGIEASARYTFQHVLRHLDVSYAYCHLDKKSGELVSKYALDYLTHSLSCGLEHSIYKNLGGSWQVTAHNRCGSYFDVDGNQQEYDPFVIVDGQIFWQNHSMKLYVEASNLFDKTYYDYGGIEQPGRWVKMGIQVRL